MMTAVEMLRDAQRMLNLNQRELGVYAGVQARTVNRWMTGETECPYHVAELIFRLAEYDWQALEDDQPTKGMMRWAVIDDTGTDISLTVCGSKADALREGEYRWSHLAKRDQERRQSFAVGLVHVCLNDGSYRYGGRFSSYQDADGNIDGDVYEVEKKYK